VTSLASSWVVSGVCVNVEAAASSGLPWSIRRRLRIDNDRQLPKAAGPRPRPGKTRKSKAAQTAGAKSEAGEGKDGSLPGRTGLKESMANTQSAIAIVREASTNLKPLGIDLFQQTTGRISVAGKYA
jgi:hypothetical protein